MTLASSREVRNYTKTRFVVCTLRKTTNMTDILVDKAKEMIRSKRSNFKDLSFEQYAQLKSSVYELKYENSEISCTCPLGMKHKYCKQKVGLMIKD